MSGVDWKGRDDGRKHMVNVVRDGGGNCNHVGNMFVGYERVGLRLDFEVAERLLIEFCCFSATSGLGPPINVIQLWAESQSQVRMAGPSGCGRA